MKQKCSFILKASTALVLCFLMLFGTVTTSLAAVVDDNADTGAEADLADTGASNLGTVYFDNARTNWSNVYCFVGHSGYVRAYKMDATVNPKVFYKNIGGFTDRTAMFFASAASSTMTGGTSSYNINSGKSSLTSGNYTANISAGDDANHLFVPASSSNDASLSRKDLYVVAGTIAANGWSNTADVMNHDGSKYYRTYSDKTATDYTFAVVKFNDWGTSYRWAAKGTLTANNAGSWADAGDGDHNIKLTTTKTADVTVSLNSSNKVDVLIDPPTEPSIDLSSDKDTLYIGGGVTDTATITTTKENTSATPTYSVTRNGSAATANTDYTFNTSTGVFTPKKTGTFVITGSITDGSTYTDSVSITVSDRVVYLLGLTNEGTWTPTDSGNKANKMTYNSSTSLYELTINLYQSSTTYNGNNGFKIQDAGTLYGKNSTTLTTSSTSASGLTTSGGNLYLTTKNVGGSSTVPYKFTYNASTKAVTVYYPMKVTFNANGHGTAPTAQVVAYGGTATNPGTLTATDGYTHNGKWYTASSCADDKEWNFSTTLTEDKTLYAKWTGAQKVLKVQAGIKTTSSGSYTLDDTTTAALTMDGTALTPAGSTGSKYQTKNVAVGDTCTLVAPNKGSGYVFLGWYNGSTRVSTDAQYTYTHTMANADTTLVARYDRKYTLTINAGSNGKVDTNQSSVSKTVFYSDAPGSFTISPNSGYQLDTANSTNLSTYYTVSGNSATGKAAANITDANKVDKTITIAFEEIAPVVNFSSYKTDDGSTYSAGGGALTATWTTGGGGGGGEDPTPDPEAPARYLWKNVSNSNTNNPSTYTVMETFTAATDGNYYTSFSVAAGTNFYFLINDSTTDSLSGSKYIYSTTSIVKGSGISDWAATENYNYSGTDYRFCKGYCATTVYVKFSPTEDKIYLQDSAFTYTAAGSGGGEGGGEGEGESTSGSVVSGGTVPYDATVTFSAPRVAAVSGDTYQFDGWYSTAQPASNETALSTELTYTKSNVNDDVTVYARYKKVLYLTFYNSYMREDEYSDWQFVAAPPRTVTVGTGSSTRATYTYKAGNAEQRGEDHTVNATGDYYEGNTLLVLVGETVTLKFSTLASSDAIRGIFFNNDRRYTTETEDNNLYYHREYKAGGWGEYPNYDSGVAANDVPDDDWEYTYLPNTTIYADENYYDGATATTIHNNYNSYVGKNAMDQSTHEISWVATQSYLNIDIELDRKYQLHINDDEWEGLKIENMNDEGYYFGGETFDNDFKISIDNTDVTDGEYVFTGTTATATDKDGDTVSGVTVTAKDSSGNTTSDLNQLSYFLVSGTMPRTNVYINIPAVKQYKMRLANIVVSDNGTSTNKRTMLTETSGSATSSTGNIGTITAVPKTDGTPGADISSDGTYYTYPDNNNAGEVSIYTSSTNNKYLKGGVNKNGSTVAAGSTVTYTFTFASGKDAEYTFVGWFEGDKNGDTFTPNYNKKLSGKQSFTYTPKKDTIVFAVGTRDIYLGGNFTSDGAYTTTSASKTWSSGRILMDFDPTYTNPNDSTKKGRYVYKFETVTPNTEYQFRCYDTASGTDTTNLSIWSTWSGSDYADDNDDIFYGRHMYDAQYGYSHGAFVYKTNTNNWSLIDNTAEDHDSNKNHQANGYAAPVEVYFYAYDGGITVNSTYQWSRAYVSAGVGIDVKSVSGGTTTYNTPTVSVANKTVNNKDVTVTSETYGQEAIKNCLVKENNGQIVVTASPADENLELQAFLVYNIDTKKSEAVKTFTTSGDGDSKAYIGNITIPNNSKIYVVPIYKFTDQYIDDEDLETHDVFVRADDIDKDDWGGLVSMYSWGTTSGYDSGGWPGQLMVPSDDGNSFIAPLTFQAGGLAGVTFNNYTKVWGGNYVNFLGLYQSRGVSDTVYSGYTNTGTHYIYQVFDYREPISIIDNINTPEPKIYDSEDMTLTFELKPGNKTSGTVGNGAYNASFDYEYLTDSSGKYRVDLNGNKLSTNSTATYYVVCNYTEAYKSNGSKTYGFAPSTHNMYSIDWNVYDINGVAVANGTQLSASFTDVEKSEMLTYIAKQLIDDGRPVSGKAVKIAYENPKISSSDNTEAVRYSGQWYADGINTIIEGNVRVGIYSDGAWLPSDTNAPGYATATVEFAPDASKGEAYVTEDGCSGNSLAKVTKIHAANGDVTFRVNTTDNFLGWYREDGKGGYEPIGSNYKNQTVSLSFNEDITYYAFYNASASYRVKYKGRFDTGADQWHYFTAMGSDLTEAELANGGTLDATTRATDIATKLAKARNDISVFNKTYSLNLNTTPDSTPYTLTYTATQNATQYTLTPYAYKADGSALEQKTAITNTWGKSSVLPYSYATTKPAGKQSYKFAGWIPYSYDESTYVAGTASSYPEILSTQVNFGYSLAKNMSIKPFFVATDAEVTNIRGTGWQAGIDKHGITQELTSATTGTIYNDTLVNFRNKEDTGTLFTPGTTGKSGVVILFQDADSKDTYGSTFTSMTDATAQGFAKSMIDRELEEGKYTASAKLRSSYGYGTAYAYRVEVQPNQLSSMNRADLYMGVDYAKYSGANYKVIAYTKVGSDYSYSTIASGTFTPTV